MDNILVLPYSEYVCASQLAEHFSTKAGFSIFAPLSRQEKGIDLLLCRSGSTQTQTATFQVKSSRTYPGKMPKRKGTVRYRYYTWFNRFHVSERADFFLLLGIYPGDTGLTKRNVGPDWWQTLILVFDNTQMREFMREVKTKTGNDDPMFGFGFDTDGEVILTRGDPQRRMRDYSHHLLKYQVTAIRQFLTE